MITLMKVYNKHKALEIWDIMCPIKSCLGLVIVNIL
jgi:hypothetical protein